MGFQPYMVVQIIFFVFTIIFLIRENKIINQDPFFKTKKKYFHIIHIIILIGILLRSFDLSYPQGVFVDEAMGAYDSWCLANYGIDSNLMSFPVYLKSWGTGQSALYAYLALPFIKIFGLSAEVYRLPMSIIGCLSVLIIYYTLRKTPHIPNPINYIFAITTFLVINPWHIIKSRFAVDCNICPDIILIGICLIILGIYSLNKKKQTFFYLAGFAILAISAYGYAVSWFCLPILYTGLVILLIKKKKINNKQLVSVLITSFVILFPLILFAFNLAFKFDQYSIGAITIPQLNESRHNATTLLGSPNFLQQLLLYIKYGCRVLFLGVDNLDVSSLSVSGIFYNSISLPFLCYGIYKSIKEKYIYINIIFGIWLIACLPIILIVEPNINHWNILWFPVIYFTGYGIYKFISISKTNVAITCSIYAITFLSFLRNYFDKNVYSPFYSQNFKEEIIFTKDKDFVKIYYPQDFVFSYTVFYNPINPSIFRKTYISDQNPLSSALAYDNIIFGTPDIIIPQQKTAYIIANDQLQNIDLNLFHVEKGDHYSVLWND